MGDFIIRTYPWKTPKMPNFHPENVVYFFSTNPVTADFYPQYRSAPKKKKKSTGKFFFLEALETYACLFILRVEGMSQWGG